MQFTKEEARSIIGFAGMLFCGGLVYKGLEIYANQCANKEELRPETEALYRNRDLFHLFVQLQEYRDMDEVAFRQAVECADKLLLRYFQITENKITPTSRDGANAGALFFGMDDGFQIMLGNEKVSAKRAASFYKLYRQVYHQTLPFMKAILNISKNV